LAILNEAGRGLTFGDRCKHCALPNRPHSAWHLSSPNRTVAQQQKQIEALTAAVQKASDRLKLNNSAPRVAANDQYKSPDFTAHFSVVFPSMTLR
jgi:hypothetical protein